MHGFGKNIPMHQVPPERFGAGFAGVSPLTAGLIGAGLGYLGGEIFDQTPGYGGYGPGYGPGFGGYGAPGYGTGYGPGFSGYGPGFGSYGPGYGNPGFKGMPGYGYQGHNPGFGNPHYGNVGYNHKYY